MRLYVGVLTLVFSTLAVPHAFAQTAHAASSSVLDAAVQQHVASSRADRELVERLLDRADVKAVAAGAGIDIRTVATAVRTMDSASLSAVASQALTLDQALAGGQSKITLNVTYLIIGLLVLIVLILALQ
jgi:hypothetical protein